MIKLMLKPFLKRYIGLFISMVFVSMLSIALLSAFVSTITNLTASYKSYLSNYESVDAVIKTNLIERSDISGFASDIHSVKNIDARLTMDAYLKKDDGRVITSRIYTFNETENKSFRRYILSSIPKSEEKLNVSVIRKFANNNNFELGQTIKVGYLDFYLDFHINEIIETPEAIQARANEYVWSDNTDFGYLYINETELDKAIYELSVLIRDKYNKDPEYKEYYDSVIKLAGLDIPDFINQNIVGKNFASSFANQLLIEGNEGVSEKQALDDTKAFLESKEIKVKEANEVHSLFYIIYIENAIKQLRVAAIFLPIFFYGVTMIVIGLFINQIIKAMTPEFGIMMSIGVGKKDITSIFLIYSLLMSIIAGIIGVGVGYLLNYILSNTLIRVYSMPTIPTTLDPLITFLAIIALAAFAVLTTLIACKRISKITPKDATTNNEANRKQTPKWIEKRIEKMPMNARLGLNSIIQNPRRFFISTFSIFAAFVIIILALFFSVSKNELMDQATERRLNFDCQVYMAGKADNDTINEIKNSEYVTKFEDCYYTYLKATSLTNEKSSYLECLAIDDKSNQNMINIPSSDGSGVTKVKHDGIIINQADADEFNVKIGDKLKINNIEIEVVDISLQYFHPLAYLSKDQMERLNVEYTSSFLINVNDEVKFLEFISETEAKGLTVFTSSLKKDIHGIFDSIDIFIYIMIGFSFGMGFIILSIMSQNTLMEQKRQLSIFRAIGFRIKDISNLWLVQSGLQLVISTLFAVPIGYLVASILFILCSSKAQTYPRIFSVPSVCIAFGFIFLIVLLSHILSMYTIKKWNISDNTKSRE